MATMLEQLSHDDKLQAHWAKRLVALFIDVAVVWGPIYVFMALIGWMIGFAWFMGAVVIGFVWFLYSAFLEFAMGATVGKMVMGLKVVPTEGRLELYNAMMRNLVKVFGLFLAVDFVLTLLLETTDPRQRFTDKMAKTTVIEQKGMLG
jgi:uncharacterized RDD family membrane protein YckC